MLSPRPNTWSVSPASGTYAMTTLIDLAQRQALPEIKDGMLTAGSWSALPVSMAAPYAEPTWWARTVSNRRPLVCEGERKERKWIRC